jgi:hypothetical protein
VCGFFHVNLSNEIEFEKYYKNSLQLEFAADRASSAFHLRGAHIGARALPKGVFHPRPPPQAPRRHVH